jgi:putative membrane protein
MLALPVLAATVVYALIGAVILAVAFILWDRLTPVHLWNEISEKQNIALAILAGAVAIGLSLIVAAAIHG